MGKGSGGGGVAQPTSTSVTQSNLPEYAEPYFTDLMDRTQAESVTEYDPFGGQRLAEFGADTEAGFGQIRNLATSAAPAAFGAAETALTGIAGSAPLPQQAQFAEPGSFIDAGVASQYMNPYVQNVLDAQKARLNQRFGEQRLGREAQAVQEGAFSGSRRGVQEGIAERELNLQMNELEQKGLLQAYESGASIFDKERMAMLQNRNLNADVFARNQERLLKQYAQQTGAAEQLRSQGLAGEELALGRGKTLAGVGGAYDTQRQKALDIGYADFVNQRDFDRQQLNFYSGIMRGVPGGVNQEVTKWQAPPSQLSQLLGLGVGGLGLAMNA